jgi:hypothetical protein
MCVLSRLPVNNNGLLTNDTIRGPACVTEQLDPLRHEGTKHLPEGLRLVRTGITEGTCFGFIDDEQRFVAFWFCSLVMYPGYHGYHGMFLVIVCSKREAGKPSARRGKTHETWGVEICRWCCAFLCASWNKAHTRRRGTRARRRHPMEGVWES